MSKSDPSPLDVDDDGAWGVAANWCTRMADHALSPQEQSEFEVWREADQQHQIIFEQVAKAWRLAGQAAAEPAMLSLRRAAFEDLDRARAFRGRRRQGLGWAAAAASVALLAGSLAAVVHATPRVYSTAVGERRVVVLPDGSKVSMDGSTRVRVRYAQGRRQFWLEGGRAKFSVAKDPLRPFTVAAAGEMVVATGTQFSVELLNNQVRVALYEGHVTVWRGDSDKKGPLQPIMAGSSAAEQALTPGRELVAQTNASDGEIVDVDPVRSLSWEGGQLVFDNEPLASAVEQVNRYADQPLRVTEGAGRAIHVSGVFVEGDENAFVQGVVSLFPVRAVRSGDGLTLEIDPTRYTTKTVDSPLS